MKTIRRTTAITFATFLIAGGMACSKQPPLETFGAAKMAVQESEKDAQIARLAPAELQNAQQKLAEAKEAMEAENYVKARRLSEQAIVDAQLAKAKTQAMQSRVGALQEKDAINVLQSEINRNRY